jgi:Fe-S-cluster containining protein
MTLNELHTQIDHRVAVTRADHPDWLCRTGCEGCCHRLAAIPQLTEAEWALLQEGLSLLPQIILESIRKSIAALKEQSARHIVCPMLNQETGTCRVYPYRPTACRTYGFYVQRDKGLYCKDIETQVDSGILDNVVWGNQDAIEELLKHTGETRQLTEWFDDWKILNWKIF